MPDTPIQVLLVDDDADLRDLLRNFFQQRGIEFSVLHDATHLARRLERERPSIIVLDLMMPDVTGYEVLEILRDDEQTREVPIVVLTAVTMQRERDRCMSKGADAVMIKPFDPRDVAQAVGALLSPAQSA